MRLILSEADVVRISPLGSRHAGHATLKPLPVLVRLDMDLCVPVLPLDRTNTSERPQSDGITVLHVDPAQRAQAP